MARQNASGATGLLAWAGMAGVMISAIALARHDRSPPRSAATTTVRLPVSSLRPPSPSEMREAADDLERAAARAQQATADLEQLKKDLDDKRAALESVKADADANADRTKRELEDARDQLASRQSDLEKASREAEARVRSASQDLERFRHQQLSMMPPTARDHVASLTPRMPPTLPLDPRLASGLPASPSMPVLPSMELPAVRGKALVKEPRPIVTMDQASRFAASAAPRRFSSDEFNRTTGEIAWPTVLSDATYGDLKTAIEGPFRERAARGGDFDETEQAQVKFAIDALVARLRSERAKHSSGRYGAAQTFLDSLRAESTIASGP